MEYTDYFMAKFAKHFQGLKNPLVRGPGPGDLWVRT